MLSFMLGGAAAAVAASGMPLPVLAQASGGAAGQGLPKPGTPAGDSLARLLAGNKRYQDSQKQSRDLGATRAQRAAGQAPFAAIFGCADSRTAPEIVFDQGLGDIFTVRNAGVVVDPQALGSLEYAVAVLGAPLVMTLGHSSCGAIDAAIGAVREGKTYPGHIEAVVSALTPGVRATLKDIPADTAPAVRLSRAIDANARLGAQQLVERSAILRKARDEGRIAVVAAVYDIAAGEVRLLGAG